MSQPRILFFSDNFPPEINAPANRTYEHCLEWVKQGAQVTVITCNPNFPAGKLYKGHKNRLIKKEEMDGIKVIRVWSFITPNRGTFKRIADYMSYAFSSFFASLFVKTDIIIATSPQLFAALGGCMSAIVKRKPWIMEVRDLWPESIHALGAINNKRVLNMLERLVSFLYRKASSIVVVTDSFKKRISEEGIALEKMKVVKNGVNRERYFIRDKDQSLIEKLGLQDKFIVAYIGTHGMAHGLDRVLDAAAKVQDNRIQFLLIGAGALKKRLLREKDTRQLSNVTMLDPVPREKVSDYISIIDLALVPLKKSDTFKTVIPSKIFENAAMGKPILLGVEGESKRLIEDYGAGLTFEPDNPDDLVSKLEQVANNQEAYKQYQEGCKQLTADFDRIRLAKSMYEHLKKVREKA